jgi:hypothetical protein
LLPGKNFISDVSYVLTTGLESYPPIFNFSGEDPIPEQWRSFYQVQYTQALAYISALCAVNIELEQHARAPEK